MTELVNNKNYSKEEMKKALTGILPEKNLLENEPLKSHTTFRIGGPADFFLKPENIEQMQEIITVCRQQNVPCFYLGNGSNLLVSDAGYRGVVLQVFQNMSEVTVNGTEIFAKAGTLLSKVANAAAKEGLTGLEFASGIPGTIGGAVVMNAGAYGGEMKDVVKRVTVLTRSGDIKELELKELELGYRSSCIEREGYLVVSVCLELKKGNHEEIQKKMEELRKQRMEKQPLEYPSAGSTFKRPEGYFAGKLIMDCGLRGYRCNDAVVSEKHCGFVINEKDATAEDVKQLIKEVQDKVYEKFGVVLETEVKMIGE